MKEPRLRFAISREVEVPKRASDNEAGIDFYIPTDLTEKDIQEANKLAIGIDIHCDIDSSILLSRVGNVCLKTNQKGYISEIWLGPNSRIVIPSGVFALIEPSNSALIAANKSGISTKKGLTFGAQVVDSTYTGEIHISLINNCQSPQSLRAGDKVVQFIHTPIYTTKVEEISVEDFNTLSKGWSERGSNWQGSTDND